MKIAGNIHRICETLIISVAKINERVDMQSEAHMRGNRG